MTRPRGRIIRGPKRATAWGQTDLTTTAVAAGAKVLMARFTAATLLAFAPSGTVVRERGSFLFTSDQIAADELYQGAVGFARVSEIAAAAGAASIPGPVTDAGWDGWYGWYPVLGHLGRATDIGFAEVGYRQEIDVKAMRKFGVDDSLVIMAENASGSTGFNVLAQIRTLFKLH